MYLDVDTDDPKEAYAKVFNSMARCPLDWESCDEDWFDAQGDQMEKSEIQEARSTYFNDPKTYGLRD